MIKSPLTTVFITAAVITMQTPALASKWGLGIAAATQQSPYSGVERKNLASPYITYEGDHLKVDLGSMTYFLYESDTIELSLLGELRFDGYEPNDSYALEGMGKREPSFDSGFILSHKADWGLLKLSLLGDITKTHDGIEARALYQYPYVIGRWIFLPSIGFCWQDGSLVDYYYGVREGEANTSRPAYLGYEATNAVAEFSVGYMLSDDMEMFAGIQTIQFDESISDSPIIARNHQTTAITSLIYKF